MYKKLYCQQVRKLLLFGIIILLVCCHKNHAPVIQSITCTPESGKPGTVFSLSVAASDEDGDILNYHWIAEVGEFTDSTNQTQTKWKSPLDGSGKTFSIEIAVTDGQVTTTGSHQIKLASNNEPVITDILSIPPTDVGGALFVVKVLANDPDNDPLTYAWTCTEGAFTEGMDRSLARWQSPLNQQDKTYRLSVEISDGIHKIDSTLQINVLKSPGGSVIGNTFFTGCTIPVSGVTLTIADKSTLSDSAGRFEIKDVPYGTQNAVATKTDFIMVTKEIIISSGATIETDFHLTSQRYTSKVFGVVKDQEGNLMTGAIITVLNPDQTESDLKTTSDSQGSYEINAIPQGDRTILVRKDSDQAFRFESTRFDIQLTGHETPTDIVIQKVSLVPAVLTQPLSLVSYNYAKGGGEVTYEGESPVIKRGICWSENPDATITDNKSSNGSGAGSFESSLTGLSSGTTYYFRAYATNSNGKTGYGEENSFITIPNGTFTDARDQKTYKTVQIGNQTWMAENLNFAASSGSWCYEDKESYCASLGRLYDKNRMINVGSGKDICPAGWRVPTDAEWAILAEFLGDKVVFQLKSSSGWSNNSNGDNSTGFNAKPGGTRYSDGSYDALNELLVFWTATMGQEGYVTYAMSSFINHLVRYESYEIAYVRCLKY